MPWGTAQHALISLIKCSHTTDLASMKLLGAQNAKASLLAGALEQLGADADSRQQRVGSDLHEMNAVNFGGLGAAHCCPT